jgi:hypothetical protein
MQALPQYKLTTEKTRFSATIWPVNGSYLMEQDETRSQYVKDGNGTETGAKPRDSTKQNQRQVAAGAAPGYRRYSWLRVLHGGGVSLRGMRPHLEPVDSNRDGRTLCLCDGQLMPENFIFQDGY